MRLIYQTLLCLTSILPFTAIPQSSPPSSRYPLTPYELSGGARTTTYAECIQFYRRLDGQSPRLSIKEMGSSDAGYPYHLILYSNDGQADPAIWRRQHKLIIFINNGIHPGEPDGIDASMLLLRDLVTGKNRLPDNIALAVIPVYNIGGALNRGSYSRANQNGPESYGFRGNAQNLDLNRDFTKNDSHDARSFARIFRWVDPDILVDTHVSDGADYPYTMTLISTQWNKLGGELGTFLHDIFQPALFTRMEQLGWPMCPYVGESGFLHPAQAPQPASAPGPAAPGNPNPSASAPAPPAAPGTPASLPSDGWTAFYDQPRYSTGYAALFHTISFMPETHMLKPFRDRVRATYDLLRAIISQGSVNAQAIVEKRQHDFAADLQAQTLPLHWKSDPGRYDSFRFRGYTADYKPSEVSGQPRLYYDHTRPWQKTVKYYNYFIPDQTTTIPEAYIIPQGWQEVIDRLRDQGVKLERLENDTVLNVEACHIADYQSSRYPYEKHHRNTAVRTTVSRAPIRFLKGDYRIPTHQPARRFLAEMLEPTGEDAFFSWNFFDAILQQKEGYSDYRWEDLAASLLKEHPEWRQTLETQIKTDSALAASPEKQLAFIFRLSPYYEPEHLRYPVYKL